MTTTPRAYTVLSCVFKLPSNSRSGRKTARAIATSTDLHDANVAAMNYMINIMRGRDEQIELCESAVPNSVMPDSLAAFFKIKPEFDKTKIEYSNEGRVKLSVAIRSKPHQRPGSEYIYCFVSQDAQAAAYIQGFFDRNNPEWHTRRAVRSNMILCVICQDDLAKTCADEVICLRCQHRLHRDCMAQWEASTDEGQLSCPHW